MKPYSKNKIPSFILCTMLIVSMAFLTAGCNGRSSDNVGSSASGKTESTQTENSVTDGNGISDESSVTDGNAASDENSVTDGNAASNESSVTDGSDTSNENGTSDENDTSDENSVTDGNGASDENNVLGEGSTQFTFAVTDPDGNETVFEIHTDQETIGAALTELGLIEGEDSAYGLYVKTVNGITIDPDKDSSYWAFYINGAYAQTGVDATPVTEGDSYSFKAEKV